MSGSDVGRFEGPNEHAHARVLLEQVGCWPALLTAGTVNGLEAVPSSGTSCMTTLGSRALTAPSGRLTGCALTPARRSAWAATTPRRIVGDGSAAFLMA